jgi:hypothetical protein
VNVGDRVRHAEGWTGTVVEVSEPIVFGNTIVVQHDPGMTWKDMQGNERPFTKDACYLECVFEVIHG